MHTVEYIKHFVIDLRHSTSQNRSAFYRKTLGNATGSDISGHRTLVSRFIFRGTAVCRLMKKGLYPVGEIERVNNFDIINFVCIVKL